MNRFSTIDPRAYRMPLLFGLLLTTSALAERTEPMRRDGDYRPFPQPEPGYVTDHAQLLTPRQKERIERLLWQAESRTGTEIAVVTIGSIRDYPEVQARSIEAFARKLFDAYGIGNMPANDGVLLLVARHDRQARIELGAGYGRSMDATAHRIMDRTILPCFRKGDYAQGIDRGIEAILREFAGVRILNAWHVLAALLLALALGGIAFSMFKNGKGDDGAGIGGVYEAVCVGGRGVAILSVP